MVQRCYFSFKRRYAIQKVICFGLVTGTRKSISCFTEALVTNDDHYFLFVVTQSSKRVEARTQNLLKQKFSLATVSVVAVSKDEFEKTDLNRNQLFKPVFESGFVLYDATPETRAPFPKMDDGEKYAYTSSRFESQWENALSFLESAHKCMEEDRWHNAIFLLHQAVEQTCIAFIKVHLDHYAIYHNLNYLLNLCLCIEPQMAIFLPQKTNEEIRLFNVLNKAYDGGRYQESFEVNDKDLET